MAKREKYKEAAEEGMVPARTIPRMRRAAPVGRRSFAEEVAEEGMQKSLELSELDDELKKKKKKKKKPVDDQEGRGYGY